MKRRFLNNGAALQNKMAFALEMKTKGKRVLRGPLASLIKQKKK